MKIVKYFALIIAMMSLYILCSYFKGGGNDLKLDISTLNINELSSKIYDDLELVEIVKFNGSLNELNEQYPVECLRENNGIYRISYLGNKNVVVLLFDDSGNKISGNIHSTQRLKDDFTELEKGDLLNEVREIDPDGEYLFLYTGRNDTPKESFHYTKDGYLITIKYDDSNTIINISEELI